MNRIGDIPSNSGHAGRVTTGAEAFEPSRAVVDQRVVGMVFHHDMRGRPCAMGRVMRPAWPQRIKNAIIFASKKVFQ